MKKAFLFIILLQICFDLRSQTSEELFNTNSIIVLGVDFSLAKIITEDSTGFYQTNLISEIEQFNSVFVKRCLQYKKLFNVRNMLSETSTVFKTNSSIKPLQSLANDEKFISSVEIAKEKVEGYKNESNSNDVGMILFMENIDEIKNRMFFYIVFFERASGKILVIDKMKIGISTQKKFKGAELWQTGIMNILGPMPTAYKFWRDNPR